MAIAGVRYHGGRKEAAAMKEKAPQKKTRTQRTTTILSAATNPNRLPSQVRPESTSTLFHWWARYKPGARPWVTNWANHALYVWLPRSPASMWRCQKHGISRRPDSARMEVQRW